MSDPALLDTNKDKGWISAPPTGESGTMTVPDAMPQGMVFSPGYHHDARLAALERVIKEGGNPFLEAASVLLRTLAELPVQIDVPGLHGLHTLLVQEVQTYTRLCEQTNLRRDHMLAVRYALCTALDEAINLKPGSDASGGKTSPGLWSTQALLNQFHGENGGGRTVFLLIGRLANMPNEHMPVLEVLHHVLCLGFMGSYRTQQDGHRVLETVRHRLYTLVSATQESVPRELSQHWQGVGQGRFKLLRSVPVWVSASVLGLALFAQFSWYKYHLLTQGRAVQKSIEALSTLQPPVVQRSKLNLPELLQAEVAQGRVQIDEDAQRARVVFKGDGMFSGGLATLSPDTLALLTKVANALAQIDGAVRVLGHTDNQPVNLPEFPNNQVLSQKRAQAVLAVLQAHGVDAARLQAEGKGDTQPVQPNTSAEGRSKNRRVEIELLAPVNK
ncbi:type VI secretion system protein TssL, long form [Rhodoferax aquaticus]|uniref:Type VI secretion system protein TssL n=1 Tax=Rhodoferax aquaticus TaxID=2527691 RepID=A0A515EPU5_9BURK|nr:type VI secretion system protein TssL, long form [Rhodoferax aquaticus]QDL54683.1 type VI secretion system protein TssL [Rhodoferax aquaticus]